MNLECLHGVLPLLAGGATSGPFSSRRYLVSSFVGNVPQPAPPLCGFSAEGLKELGYVLLAAPLLEELQPPPLPGPELEAARSASPSRTVGDDGEADEPGSPGDFVIDTEAEARAREKEVAGVVDLDSQMERATAAREARAAVAAANARRERVRAAREASAPATVTM